MKKKIEEISGYKSIQGEVRLSDPDACCDERTWDIECDDNVLKLRLINDANDQYSTDLIIKREGLKWKSIVWDGIEIFCEDIVLIDKSSKE